MLKCYDPKHYLELKHSSIQKRLIHVVQNKYVFHLWNTKGEI